MIMDSCRWDLIGTDWSQAIRGLLAGVPEQVTNIFRPHSTPGESIYQMSLLTLAICGGIFLVVSGLLVYIIIRFRNRPNDEQSEPPQIYGSNQIELAWTVFPILIVFVLILVTARTISDVQNAAHPADSLKVTVIGHQWWWEIRYPDLGIVTANELHVPVSDPARPRRTILKLQSADVAHSYWVPQLGGKTDLIPNRDNYMWFDPRETGVYLGNCAEYCGTQHAHMLIRVIVHRQDEFDRWVVDQQKPAVADAQVRAGQKIFFSTSCVNCHTISGTVAQGKFGPDLTHLMSRETLGAGAVKNTPDSLRAWVSDPQKIKEGCLMPDMQLSQQELDQIVAYLLTLK
jgi:cytochrome c oxidase subunit II